MADLLASAVVINERWRDGGIPGKRLSCMDVTVTLSTQGAGTTGAKIPVAAFLGLRTIEEVSNFIKSDNSVVIPASPNAANTEVILGGGSSNTAASYSGTFNAVIKGKE